VRIAVLLLTLTACGCSAPVREAAVDQEGVVTGKILARGQKQADQIAEYMLEAGRHAADRFEPCQPAENNLAELSLKAREKPTPVVEYDLYRAVRLAVDWARATGGSFDPTVAAAACPERIRLEADWRTIRLFPEMEAVSLQDPSLRLDLSGLSDGYILDEMIRGTARIGVVGAMIHRGRVTTASGKNGEEPWLGRFEVLGLQAEVDLRGRAFAVRTGAGAPSDVEAVVTWASSAADADALAESLWNAGSAPAARWLADADRMEALLYVRRGERSYWLASGSLADRLRAQNDESERILSDIRFLLPPVGR
jgi:thiamine biosynthesis lipoprotein ApbE